MWSLIGGIIAVVVGAMGLIKWFSLFVKGLEATIPAILVLGGIAAVAAGISSIKDDIAAKKEKEEEKEEPAAEEVKPEEKKEEDKSE
ncbi:hypothetical protein KAI19_00770 [bacterium]|nr:hypothetical protein [bacterium]